MPQAAPEGWSVQIEAIEMLGAERLLYTRLGSEQLIVRTDEKTGVAPDIGSTLHVVPQAERLHSFDANTGQLL